MGGGVERAVGTRAGDPEPLVEAVLAGHAMHTALVSRLLRDRPSWELATMEEPVAVAAPAGVERSAAATFGPALLPSQSFFASAGTARTRFLSRVRLL